MSQHEVCGCFREVTTAAIALNQGCNQPVPAKQILHQKKHATPASGQESFIVVQTDPLAIKIRRLEIPVICYHQVRPISNNISKSALPYIISPEKLNVQLKILHENGYKTILPAGVCEYVQGKKTIPDKVVMITFDDGTIGQFTGALPLLDKYGFKAVFFIMTVVLNKPNYFSAEQIVSLTKQGHVIGCHTWDHHNVTGYTSNNWIIQLQKPTQLLLNITGEPIICFAYPNGIWNNEAIDSLKQSGYKAAFQLAGKTDPSNKCFTIRRIIADGRWDGALLLHAINNSFR